MISWADTERDLSAWLGNPMQSNAIHELYRLEKKIKRANDETDPGRLAEAADVGPLLLHVHQVLRRRRRAQVLQPL